MVLYHTSGKAAVAWLLRLFAAAKAPETSAFSCALKLLKCVVPPGWVANTATPITNGSGFLVGKEQHGHCAKVAFWLLDSNFWGKEPAVLSLLKWNMSITWNEPVSYVFIHCLLTLWSTLLSLWLIIQTPVVQIRAFSERENGEWKEIKQSINERKWVKLWHDNLYLG